MNTVETKQSSVDETNLPTNDISFLKKDRVWLEIPVEHTTFSLKLIKQLLHRIFKRRKNARLPANSISLAVNKDAFLIRLHDLYEIRYLIYLHHNGNVSVARYDGDMLSEIIVDVSVEHPTLAASAQQLLYCIAAREYFVSANHLA